MVRLPEEASGAAIEALHYMQALEWISRISKPGFAASPETIVRLNEILLYGISSEERGHGFRKTYLPYKKGSVPLEIPREVKKLCDFCNGEYFSPLGQASVIHHAFERMVPFDSMIDRTGLLFAFMPMFRRGLFANELMVPICWGASLEREYRRILKDASRKELTSESHKVYKEQWAAYNARNTSMGVVIANMFISKVSKLRDNWRSRGLKIPANSATDKLLDLFLAVPQLATRRAASCIGKSYGATNEAMRQLVKAGIVKEVAIDNRERVFVCDQSAALTSWITWRRWAKSPQSQANSAWGARPRRRLRRLRRARQSSLPWSLCRCLCRACLSPSHSGKTYRRCRHAKRGLPQSCGSPRFRSAGD